MKTRALTLATALVTGGAFAQGTFQNLGFENPTFVPINIGVPGAVQFAPAFPGWSAYVGASGASVALSNNLAIGGGAWFALLGPGWPAGGRIQGKYTAVLQAGGTGLAGDVALAQTATLPNDTQSLHFLANDFFNRFTVSVNGQPLSVLPLANFGSYNEYGTDISAYSGQEVELRFTLPNVLGSPDSFYLDSISFSPVAVPEPSTWALLGVAGAIFWCAARRRGK